MGSVVSETILADSMCSGIFKRFSTESGTPIAQNHEDHGPRRTFNMEMQDANTMVSRFFHIKADTSRSSISANNKPVPSAMLPTNPCNLVAMLNQQETVFDASFALDIFTRSAVSRKQAKP